MHNSAPFVRRPVTLTPLIDVIFLLLLFFMLSSTFSKFGEIELSQATSGAAQSSQPSKRAFLQIGTERLVLNGGSVTPDELASRIESDQVLVSLDADVVAQRLVDILVLLRGVEDLGVTVLE